MRTPYFENSRVRLFCGNSFEVIHELQENGETFDLLLTDPPYGINQANEKPSGINAERAKAAYKDGLFDDNEQYMFDVVSPIVKKCLCLAKLGIITGGVGSRKWLPKPTQEGAMICPASPSFGRWRHQDYWPIYYYGEPFGNIGKYRRISHIVNERGFSKDHPCSKPLEFWKKLMLCGTDGVQNKRILDPFGGSGTTGRAAQDLCMKATIIELNPRYCELIARNCSQETLF